MKAKSIFFCLVVGAYSSGCASYMRESRQADAREIHERKQVASDVEMLKERLKGIQMAQEQIASEIMELKKQVSGAAQADTDLAAKLGQAINALEARDDKIQKQTIDVLSKKVAAIMNTQISVSSASYGTGVEHTVESGQTLSAIAQAYGVTVSAIVKANNITNPNSVRAGQKLFIPR